MLAEPTGAAPTDAREPVMRRLWTAAVLAGLAALVIACGGISPQPAAKPDGSDPAVPTTSPLPTDQKPITFQYDVHLLHAYEKNEAEADSKYTGKLVEFLARGPIEKVAVGRYAIGVRGVSPAPAWTTAAVLCLIDPQDNDKLARAGTDKAFMLRGICKGRTPDDSTWVRFRVTVDNCRVLGLYAWRKGKGYQPLEPE